MPETPGDESAIGVRNHQPLGSLVDGHGDALAIHHEQGIRMVAAAASYSFTRAECNWTVVDTTSDNSAHTIAKSWIAEDCWIESSAATPKGAGPTTKARTTVPTTVTTE